VSDESQTREFPCPVGVVIPAHNEQAVIGRCLESIVATAGSRGVADVRVVVVANGCQDRTAEVARSYKNRIPRLVVMELSSPGKIGALNAGDAELNSSARIYLDADIELVDGALEGMRAALEVADPVVASPLVSFDITSSSAWVRAWYGVFERLPYATVGLVGLGVYGLSATGRERFDAFPAVTGDDLFVQRLFGPAETVTSAGAFIVRAPRRLSDLLAVRTRIARGNRELAADAPSDTVADATPTTGTTVRALAQLVVRTPSMAPGAMVYVALTALARRRAERGAPVWQRDASSREVPRRDG